MKARWCRLILLTLLLLTASCARFLGHEGTPEAKRAALMVVNQYLTAVANGRSAAITDLIAWQEYLKNKDDEITKAEIVTQIDRSKKMWNVSDHPLMNLAPKEIDVRDNDAVVVLRKMNAPQNRLIQIEAQWIGGGWIIVNDNLFGKTGVITDAVTRVIK